MQIIRSSGPSVANITHSSKKALSIRFQFLFTDFPNKRPWLFFHPFSQTYYFTPSSFSSSSLLIKITIFFLSLSRSPLPPSPKQQVYIINAMAMEGITSIQSMPHPHPPKQEHEEEEKPLVFDASVLRHQLLLPKQFIWPDEEKPCLNAPELQVPLVDLGGFLSGDPLAAMEASRLVGEACQKHGFFLVVNHGIDAKLISDAHRFMDDFFELPLSQKQRAQRKTGEHCGYASSFTGRFSSKLPWKETLSFQFSADQSSPNLVKDYLCNTMGTEFEQFG